MPIALWTPTPPTRPLTEYQDDRDRKISGCCWDLQQVQSGVADGTLRVYLSQSASFDLTNELHWTIEDAIGFIRALHRGRYNDSEWCYFGKSHIARPADSYVMGFNRFRGEENQLTNPWVYCKFSVVEKSSSVLIHSAHLERKSGA